MILAFFCAIFVISYAGSSPARVTEVADGSPEAEAGLEAEISSLPMKEDIFPSEKS